MTLKSLPHALRIAILSLGLPLLPLSQPMVAQTDTTLNTEVQQSASASTARTFPARNGDVSEGEIIPSSCIMNNGKPCPLWLHKLIGQYPPLVARSYNWGPQPKANFFTYRKSWQAPVLHPNKKSYAIFIGSHALAWTAMTLACRNPRSGEDFGSEAPAMAAVTAFDFMVFKLFSPSMSIPGAGYAAGHYFYSDRK